MSHLVYIASPYAGDVEGNIEFAKAACRYAMECGQTPVAVHLLYPQFLRDSDPAEREAGLRMGLELVPFEKELGHIKDYLYLEKMRFGEKLRIQWELLYEDFWLPPLTVQPLVENAVRHGINKKKSGGTLTIRCERVESNVVITIHDDGVSMALYNERKRHLESGEGTYEFNQGNACGVPIKPSVAAKKQS